MVALTYPTSTERRSSRCPATVSWFSERVAPSNISGLESRAGISAMARSGSRSPSRSCNDSTIPPGSISKPCAWLSRRSVSRRCTDGTLSTALAMRDCTQTQRHVSSRGRLQASANALMFGSTSSSRSLRTRGSITS